MAAASAYACDGPTQNETVWVSTHWRGLPRKRRYPDGGECPSLPRTSSAERGRALRGRPPAPCGAGAFALERVVEAAGVEPASWSDRRPNLYVCSSLFDLARRTRGNALPLGQPLLKSRRIAEGPCLPASPLCTFRHGHGHSAAERLLVIKQRVSSCRQLKLPFRGELRDHPESPTRSSEADETSRNRCAPTVKDLITRPRGAARGPCPACQ